MLAPSGGPAFTCPLLSSTALLPSPPQQELREAVLLPMALPHLFTGIRRPQTNVLLFGVPGTGGCCWLLLL